MTPVFLIFLIVGTVAVASSILVISMRNPVHSALFLLLTFLCVAVLFIVKGAEFVGAVQVLVYAGGIMVLFLFVVMLLNAPREETDEDLAASGDPARLAALRRGPLWFGVVLALAMAVELWWALSKGRETGTFGAAATTSVR